MKSQHFDTRKDEEVGVSNLSTSSHFVGCRKAGLLSTFTAPHFYITMETKNFKRKTPQKRGPKNQASEYIKNGMVTLEYKDTKKKSYNVGSYHVVLRRMKGRQEISCSCTNHSRFPNGLCSHKRAAITFDVMSGVEYD